MSTETAAARTERAPALAGQTVVVIGGSAGIGLETARLARAEGADVILTGRNPDRLQAAARDVGALSTSAFDATDPAAVDRLFADAPAPIDHVMVTAGGPYYAPLAEMDIAAVGRHVEEHFVLALGVAKNAVGKVRAGGSLTFIGGTGGRRRGVGLSVIGAMTAAMPALVANLAVEVAPIRVNLLAPGFVDTPLSASLLGDQLDHRREELRATLPIRRVVGPEDVAALALHLMTNTALTGSTYDVDGDPHPRVTGASHGIGAGLVAGFRGAGYAVVATSRSIGPAEDADVLTVAGDLAEPDTARRVVAGAVERFGRIDTLVNNAGVFVAKPFTEYTPEDYAAVTAVNLTGFFHLTQRVIAQMVAQGGGHVVNITASLVDHADSAAPSALAALTKGGLAAVTRALATEYAGRGVRVNAVAPGVIRTAPDLAAYDQLADHRVGEIGDVVEAILYLDRAGFVTGETLHVDGGQAAGH